MAWNGSDTKAKVTASPKQKKDKSSSVRLRLSPSPSSPHLSPSPSPSPKFNYKALFAGLIVVLGGAIVAWLMLGKGDEKVAKAGKPTKASRIAVAEPQIATQVVKEATMVTPTNHTGRMMLGMEVIACKPVTNVHGGVTEYLTLADGRKLTKYTPPKSVFDNAADQMIAMMLTAKPGQAMPPLPSLSSIDQDFVKAVLSPIKINEDDSDEVKELKRQVSEARSVMVEEIKNGGSVRQVIEDFQADLQRIAESHDMAKEQIAEVKATDGEEAAEEFRARINEKFKEQGIPELALPRKKKGKQQ